MIDKNFLSLILVGTLCFGDEISVFDAGNLNISNPYGLTNTEQHIVKNKSDISRIESQVKGLKASLDELKVHVDGLSSVANISSEQNGGAAVQIKDLNKKVDVALQDIANLKSSMEQANKIHNDNNTVLKNLISELSKAVAEINKNYVSTKEFKTNLEQLSLKKSEPTVESKIEVKDDKKQKSLDVKESTNAQTDFSGKSNKQVYEIAKKAYDSKSYSLAQDAFLYLVDKNYRAAESNYYIGLVKFNAEQYSEAIEFFRKSAILNDNAKYMPTLLLKSAESFEKIGNTKNAKKFYSALSESYPKSKEADIANKKLSKLK